MTPDIRRHRGTILVIDDEPITLLTLSDILRRAGYEVLGASDSERALRQFRSREVDVVLMDDGISDDQNDLGPALKQLKPAVPIFLFSSVPTGQKPTAYADAVAAKPEDPRKLLQTLSALVNTDQRAS